jgi:hypothetical protein
LTVVCKLGCRRRSQEICWEVPNGANALQWSCRQPSASFSGTIPRSSVMVDEE